MKICLRSGRFYKNSDDMMTNRKFEKAAFSRRKFALIVAIAAHLLALTALFYQAEIREFLKKTDTKTESPQP